MVMTTRHLQDSYMALLRYVSTPTITSEDKHTGLNFFVNFYLQQLTVIVNAFLFGVVMTMQYSQ